MYLEIDNKRVQAKFTKREIVGYISSIVIAVSSFLYHVVQTKMELYDVRHELTACQIEVKELKKMYKSLFQMPGNDNSSRGTGATPDDLIAPDSTKKVQK